MSDSPDRILEDARFAIDGYDSALVTFMALRRAAVQDLFLVKSEKGWPLVDAEREKTVLLQVRDHAANEGLDPDAIEAIFVKILALSKLP